MAAGQPDVFGMGNLRIAYVHNALHGWLAGRGRHRRVRLSVPGAQPEGRRAAHARGRERHGVARRQPARDARARRPQPERREHDAGHARRCCSSRAGRARACPSRRRRRSRPTASRACTSTRRRSAGSAARSRPTPPTPSCENDIRRWAIATFYPERAAGRVPRRGRGAARAVGRDGGAARLQPVRVDALHAARHLSVDARDGHGAGPPRLNGGQRNRYFAPIRPGDVITSVVTLVDAYEKQGRLGHDAVPRRRGALDQPARRAGADRPAHDDLPLTQARWLARRSSRRCASARSRRRAACSRPPRRRRARARTASSPTS